MNAKEEFLQRTNGYVVLCAILQQADVWHDEEEEGGRKPWRHILKKGYSEEDYQAFLKSIDFHYSNGYGGQEVDGVIWLENGQWYDRGEYDGSEWWQFHCYPTIPEILL